MRSLALKLALIEMLLPLLLVLPLILPALYCSRISAVCRRSLLRGWAADLKQYLRFHPATLKDTLMTFFGAASPEFLFIIFFFAATMVFPRVNCCGCLLCCRSASASELLRKSARLLKQKLQQRPNTHLGEKFPMRTLSDRKKALYFFYTKNNCRS